jgi:hypothetical protein
MKLKMKWRKLEGLQCQVEIALNNCERKVGKF